MSVCSISAQDFREEVEESPIPVLIDFWAAWCGPCQGIAPTVEEIAREKPDIRVCKVNVDEEPALAAKFQITSIPTLILLRGGQVIGRVTGALPKEEILAFLADSL